MKQTTRCLFNRSVLQTAAAAGAFFFMSGIFAAVFAQPLRGTRNMSVTKSEFGKTAGGQTVDKYTLNNGKGISVEVLSLGGIIYSFNVPDKTGKTANISANLETVAEYEKYRPFFGALIGRYGNRIAKGQFTLDGKEYTLPINNGPNALHGGIKGFDTVVWNVKPFKKRGAVGLTLTYSAKDGEEGYPGQLDVTVVYQLDAQNRWTMDYTAKTDKTTVLNLTNHTFWNLAGFPNRHYDHILRLNADQYLPTDNTLIPTGHLEPVAGTPLDFCQPHKIGERISEIKGDHFSGGYDHCWVLNQKRPGQMTLCAEVYEPKSGRMMTIATTEPGVQFYSGNFLDGSTKAFGHSYDKHGAFCLETQHFPNSPNQPEFPSTVLKPGETFRSTTIHTFRVK
ncbi:MAG: galactose mutarotase [Planctomycetaceae bacterium]|nr:galactose mutarotase [Planctomycetaceae bacterium]